MNGKTTHKVRQRGAVLVFSLIILLLLTLISVSMIQQNKQELAMTGGVMNQTKALASAEVALSKAESAILMRRRSYLQASTPVPNPASPCFVTTDGINTFNIACDLPSPVPATFNSSTACAAAGDLAAKTAVITNCKNSNTTPTTTTAGSFATDSWYKIITLGSSNFMNIGATANTVGTIFRATDVGTGTGTAAQIIPYYKCNDVTTRSTSKPSQGEIIYQTSTDKAIIKGYSCLFPISKPAPREVACTFNADGTPVIPSTPLPAFDACVCDRGTEIYTISQTSTTGDGAKRTVESRFAVDCSGGRF